MKKYFKINLIIILLLLSSVVFAINVFNSPTTCNGQWRNCTNAFSNNANTATAKATGSQSKSGLWNNYNFDIPNNALINSVIVRSDFFASTTNGYVNIKVSGNNGVTYGPSHIFGGNTLEQTFIIDVTNDLAWAPNMLANGNLTINVTCFKQGSGSTPICNLDWIPVNVTYTPVSPPVFDFSLSTTPTSGVLNVAPGNNVTTNVTVTLLSGTPEIVSLFQTGCSVAGVSCVFTPPSGFPTYSSILKIITTTNSTIGNYTINITGLSSISLKQRSTLYNLQII